MESRKLYEVKEEFMIGNFEDGYIVLEVGERIWVYDHPNYEWPRCKGYDIAFDNIEDYLELIKVDEAWY